MIAPDVGGGFGGKLQVTPEEILVLAASVKLGKPVKWTETRSESLLSAHHGRDQIQDITIAAKRDGTVLALDVDLLADMGAYLRLVTSGIPVLGAFMFNSIYKFPAYRFACTNVFTSKTPTDAYRGAGRPEATFAIERIMDELAVELGREPLELREQNWIKHEEFPFTTVCGLEYDSGNYEAATAKAKELFDYDGLRREQQERRESGDPIQLGIGISTFTEMCGLAPVARAGFARVRCGRLGDRVDPAAAVRQGRGRHRVVRARAGPRDGLEPDRRGPARRAVRGHRGAARRHPGLAAGHGHLRLAVAGRRRDRRGQGRGEGRRQGAHDRRAPARGVRGRPRVRRRALRGQGHGQGRDDPGGRDGHLGSAQPARRGRAVAGLRRHLRPGQLLVPARHAPRRDGGRHRDGPGDDPPVRLRRRHRQCSEPADRRGAGARRPRPGHRAGPVRGGQLRRAGHAGQRHVRRLHPALGIGPAQLHHGPHRDPGDGQPAGCQGGRRGRHDRIDAGDRQRSARRGAPPGREGRRDAVHAAARVAGHPGGQGRATQETPVDTHSPGAGLGSIDPNNPQEEEVQ